MSFLRRAGSLNFALFLIASLVVILSASTVLESIYGTPFAQKNFYTAHWFDFFLGLVWLNIFCATWTRYPFKKRHIGFVITHIGILTLLIGAFLTRAAGSEGQMTLYENETKNEIVRPGFRLNVAGENGSLETFDLKSKASHLPFPISLKKNRAALDLSEIIERAAETRFLIESDEDKPNPAVHLKLSSALMGFNEKFTLIAQDPDNPKSWTKDVGPAHFVLKKDTAETPAVRLVIEAPGSGIFRVDPEKKRSEPLPIGNSGLELTDLRYFSHAKISGSRIVDDPESAPFNPAVEFKVRDSSGREEFHTRFLIFPDFPSLRGGKNADFFHLKTSLEAGLPDEPAPGTPSFVIFPSGPDNPSWRYEIYSSKGLLKKGELHLHEKIETGWRDITVEVEQLFNHGQILRKIKPAAENTASSFAIRVTRKDGGKPQENWVTENRPAVLETPGGTLTLSLDPVKAPLPFSLTLKDFRKTDYPGTANPSSFESDVRLAQAAKNVTLEKTIRMNEPLDRDGWRIFQSSYLQDPELGEASVFTIAKNPGIRLIYGGGIIILFGVILLFYFHPFFSVKKK